MSHFSRVKRSRRETVFHTDELETFSIYRDRKRGRTFQERKRFPVRGRGKGRGSQDVTVNISAQDMRMFIVPNSSVVYIAGKRCLFWCVRE